MPKIRAINYGASPGQNSTQPFYLAWKNGWGAVEAFSLKERQPSGEAYCVVVNNQPVLESPS